MNCALAMIYLNFCYLFYSSSFFIPLRCFKLILHNALFVFFGNAGKPVKARDLYGRQTIHRRIYNNNKMLQKCFVYFYLLINLNSNYHYYQCTSRINEYLCVIHQIGKLNGFPQKF